MLQFATLVLKNPRRLATSTREHAHIVDLIAAGKAEAAGDALHEHAIASRARLHAWAGEHGTRAREEQPP